MNQTFTFFFAFFFICFCIFFSTHLSNISWNQIINFNFQKIVRNQTQGRNNIQILKTVEILTHIGKSNSMN